MIPHIVFSENSTDYFPGFDRWGTESAQARPSGVKSSGICQPPVHAIALRHILDRGRENGGADQEAAESFLAESFDGWLAWHRWLATVRDPDATGLIEIHHGWESGFDNSPRWDGPYACVQPGTVPAFTRRDTLHVADSSERPDDSEYTKYLWLVQQMASVDYDDDAVRNVVGFRVRDVFFSAIMAASSDVLADLGEEIGRGSDAEELRGLARRFRDGVASTIDPVSGLARDYDILAQQWISADAVSGFAPLVSGGDGELLTAQRKILLGPEWMRHPGLRFSLPPSTSPSSVAFRPRTYWRGPVWPFLNLLLAVGRPPIRRILRTLHRRTAGKPEPGVDGCRLPRVDRAGLASADCVGRDRRRHQPPRVGVCPFRASSGIAISARRPRSRIGRPASIPAASSKARARISFRSKVPGIFFPWVVVKNGA